MENPFSVPDLFATILHQLGLDRQRVAYKHSGRFENAADVEVTRAHVHGDIVDSPLRA